MRESNYYRFSALNTLVINNYEDTKEIKKPQIIIKQIMCKSVSGDIIYKRLGKNKITSLAIAAL